MQKEDFKWFRENLKELHSMFPNKQVVISDKKVLKDFHDFEDALHWAVDNVGLGNFIIQKCTETLETHYIYSPYVVLSDQEECAPSSVKTASIDYKEYFTE